MGINIKKKCYFFNVGITFDKEDKETLKDCWNCNGNCCKSDLCNGLWCENYGIEFNKESTIKYIKNYVGNGIDKTYGYIKEVEIDMLEELWDAIEEYLFNYYGFSKEEIEKRGFIPFEFGEIIEDNSSYWEQPDISFYKKDNDILQDVIIVKKENELNKDMIDWVNEKLYQVKIKKEESLEM